MNTNLDRIIEAQAGDSCNSSDVGELLPEYILDLLEDSEAEEVEDHLLDCLHCREKYLNIFGIRSEARRAIASPDAQSSASGGKKVLKMTDFKKDRS